MFNTIIDWSSFGISSNIYLWVMIAVLVCGLVMIIKGGDWFVDSASWMAEVTGIPKLIVGATIVSIGTTLPELLVSLIAAADGEVNVCVGNAVGSVTANIGLIMALSILFMPAIINRKDYMFKSLLMLGAALLIALCGIPGENGFGSVSILISILLILIFVAFYFENIRHAIKEVKENKASTSLDEDAPSKDKKTVFKNIIMFIVGALFITFGADFLVSGCVEVGGILGGQPVRDIMAVTVVAIGTSLPELITTLTAIKKKESSLSVGNIIGANVMDLTMIMPLSCLVYGKSLPIEGVVQQYINLPACLIVGLIAIVPALISGKFKRWQGITLLSVYIAYITLVVIYSF